MNSFVPQCATPERIVIRPLKPKPSLPSPISNNPSPTKPSRLPPPTAPPTTSSFPRFGIPTTCPGCRISVSPMERGVVPGPQGSRWHSSCLVCGGKGLKEAARRDPNVPGCGKRLDSAAKTDGDGGVWCRECLVRLATAFSDRICFDLSVCSSFLFPTGLYRARNLLFELLSQPSQVVGMSSAASLARLAVKVSHQNLRVPRLLPVN